MKTRIVIGLMILLSLIIVSTAAAQLGGEDLPPNVTGDDVYRVANEMYCDVCAGIPLSTCESVTCQRWRQEIANLLGQGYEDQAIFTYFAERYGDDVTGLPLENQDRNFAFGLPAVLTLLMGGLVITQVWRMRRKSESSAHRAANQAGISSDYDRPVPDNVDSEGLKVFLKLLEEQS